MIRSSAASSVSGSSSASSGSSNTDESDGDVSESCSWPLWAQGPSRGMSKNLLEATLGIRFSSSLVWDPHPAVGLSSLCFAAPACAFATVIRCVWKYVEGPYGLALKLHLCSYAFLSFAYFGAIATCALADYFYIRRGHRSRYGKLDVYWAAMVFLWSNADFVCRGSVLETAGLSAMAIGAFLYSGCSKSLDQWAFRHSVWHLAGGAIGTYGALRLPPGGPAIAAHLPAALAQALAAFALAAAAAMGAARFLVSQAWRKALWERGAAYAQWTPVA